ncbi:MULTISPECIES: glucokinase [Inquilinus]|uniref:Glucokinase n=1 Tax=Inquilinus ginsengisoli TaxID=363840 RepID=A0ABU1JZR4_9PROT|nr:glucokinase [Inquilinus ginsengisoli]MDR6293757.1 glucokinase [Inquilinus ginsengisoli]
MPDALALIADLGGTNARFALADAGGTRDAKILHAADYPSLAEAAHAYLDMVRPPVAPRLAAFDVASPVTGDQVSLTNATWSFSIAALQKDLGLERLEVINDFTAVALAVPHLEEADRSQIGGGAPVANEPIGVLGPGTGLGVSGLVPSGGRWAALAGEGGHVTMAAASEREAAVLDRLRHRFQHVSAERVLSGMGLTNLYETLSQLDGVDPVSRDAAAVTEGARTGDPHCVEAVNVFASMLGTVAGNLALTLGSRGGVHIAGGVVPKLGDLFDRDLFRSRFEAKGRMRPFVAAIPTYLVTHPLPAFIGLRSVLGLT